MKERTLMFKKLVHPDCYNEDGTVKCSWIEDLRIAKAENKCFNLAWDYQQQKIDELKIEIQKLKERNRELEQDKEDTIKEAEEILKRVKFVDRIF